MGVTRLRLPANPALFNTMDADDPMFAGMGAEPPELPQTLRLPEPKNPTQPLPTGRVACWLQLSCEDEPDLNLGYLGVNGLDVLGQGLKAMS